MQLFMRAIRATIIGFFVFGILASFQPGPSPIDKAGLHRRL